MNRRLLVIIGAVAAVFVIAVVGASTINLAGSDTAPGEGKTIANCVSDLTIKTPVDTSVQDQNEIKVMHISGAMEPCVGQTLRADVALTGGSHVWAIFKITTAITTLDLSFDAATGAFYDTKPTVSGGDLVVAGSRVGPVSVSDFGQTTVTIANTWQ
ncbi:MAG: hypothetical protein RL196_1349 [Actinomycetota bacterium]|jgi:hypothetical protein